MHQNFYQNGATEGAIRQSMEYGRVFVGELDRLTEQPPRPSTIETVGVQSQLARLLGVPMSEIQRRQPSGTSHPRGFSRNSDCDGPGTGGSPAVGPRAPDPSPTGPRAPQPSRDPQPPVASGDQAGQRRTRARTPRLSKPQPRLPVGTRKAETPDPRLPSLLRTPRLPGKR